MIELVRISSRARNLALGWTTDVERDPWGGLRVCWPSYPRWRGGLRSVERELERARRIAAGADCRISLFVGGRRVLGPWLGPDLGDVSYMWRRDEVRDLLDLLREGEEVVVAVMAEVGE